MEGLSPSMGLILPYFGQWPVWLPAFLVSCGHNPDVDWLLFSDCGKPAYLPANVSYIPTTLDSIQALAEHRLGTGVTLEFPYKLCDLRPAYGEVFAEYLAQYDFWGHCDLDVIWGDIRSWVTDDMLRSYDIVSARRHRMCGHFSVYRNARAVNQLYRDADDWRSCFADVGYHRFDEDGMTSVVARAEKQGKMRVYWCRFLFNMADAGEKEPTIMRPWRDRWLWRDGKVYDAGREVMYLHFQRWKKSLRRCEIASARKVEEFYVSFSHISGQDGALPSLAAWFSWYKMRFRDYMRVGMAEVSSGLKKLASLADESD